MPNHVTNVLHVQGESVAQVFKRIKGKEKGMECIDFNRIIQIPEILEGESSDSTLEDMAQIFCGRYKIKDILTPHPANAFQAFSTGDFGTAAEALGRSNMARMLMESDLAGSLDDNQFETLVKYMRALRQFGECTWYEWSKEHWGTKWNAYDQKRIDSSTIQFDTAWSTPAPIWQKLSEMFPATAFVIRWADEDFGANTGRIRIAGGAILEDGRLENGTPEAYRNAVEILFDGKLPKYYRWKEDGTAEYVEELE